MGLTISNRRSAPTVFASVDVAPAKLTPEQIHMIDKCLPDFRIYQPSTERHREVAASHWDAMFKEQRRLANRYSLKNLRVSRRESGGRMSGSTVSGSRMSSHYDAFYAHVEQHSPELLPLFRSLLQVKTRVLAHVSAGMRSLLASDRIAENMLTLAKTHLEHFNLLGKALLQAMATVSEDAWTPAVADAWRRLYAHCSAILLVIQASIQTSGAND